MGRCSLSIRIRTVSGSEAGEYINRHDISRIKYTNVSDFSYGAPVHTWVVAEDENTQKLIAVASFYISRENNMDFLDICNVGVDPRYQGAGVASRLIARTFVIAASGGLTMRVGSFTEEGRRLKNLLQRLSKEHEVDVIYINDHSS